MRPAFAWSSGALIGALCLALARPASASPEDLFKWGEYDSLIRILEPEVSRPGYATVAVRSDSLEHARALLYLGVAYAATGHPARSDSAFAIAFALDSAVSLDHYYATPAIAARFDSLAAERRRHRVPAAARAPMPAVSAAPIPSPYPPAGLRAPQPGRAWLWWGLGATAAVAAGGSAWWYANAHDGTPRDNVTVIDLRNAK